MPFETAFESLHTCRFVIQSVCRICRTRHCVLESFAQGVIVVPMEVMVTLILTLHGLERERRERGKKGAFCLHLILCYRLRAQPAIGQMW